MNVAFLFPGQGSQSVGMGKEIWGASKAAAELLTAASESAGIDFEKLLFESNDLLDKSEYTQPAIVLNSLMCRLAFAERADIAPKFCMGHSLGEFSALSVSGALDAVEAIKLVNLRGKFMGEDCEGKGAGMMVVLGLADEKVEQICADSNLNAWPANYNCDGQVVVAGIKDDLAALEAKFKEAGAKRAMLLNMSVASHCKLLANASDKLVAELAPRLADSFAPVISNVTAEAYTTKADALDLLKRQLTSPVLYKQSVKAREAEVDCFIEFGASVLKGLNRKITDKPTYSVTDLASLDEALRALA